MARIKSDIDSLFKQGLSNGKAPVAGSSMSDFQRMIARKSFFSFSAYNFNIYYLTAGLALIGAIAFVVLSNDEQEKPCTVPSNEQTIVNPNNSQDSICTHAVPDNMTNSLQQAENNYPKSSSQGQGNTSLKASSPMDSMKKSMPIAQEKIEKPAAKENLITANVKQETKREVKKIDTIYQIDTIRNQKTKVRLKWKK